MVDLSTGETVTIENGIGSRAKLHIDSIFSTRIFITQLSETGTLNFSGTGYIPITELSNYNIIDSSRDD